MPDGRLCVRFCKTFRMNSGIIVPLPGIVIGRGRWGGRRGHRGLGNRMEGGADRSCDCHRSGDHGCWVYPHSGIPEFDWVCWATVRLYPNSSEKFYKTERNTAESGWLANARWLELHA